MTSISRFYPLSTFPRLHVLLMLLKLALAAKPFPPCNPASTTHVPFFANVRRIEKVKMVMAGIAYSCN
jgi:hypothetical protein